MTKSAVFDLQGLITTYLLIINLQQNFDTQCYRSTLVFLTSSQNWTPFERARYSCLHGVITSVESLITSTFSTWFNNQWYADQFVTGCSLSIVSSNDINWRCSSICIRCCLLQCRDQRHFRVKWTNVDNGTIVSGLMKVVPAGVENRRLWMNELEAAVILRAGHPNIARCLWSSPGNVFSKEIAVSTGIVIGRQCMWVSLVLLIYSLWQWSKRFTVST